MENQKNNWENLGLVLCTNSNCTKKGVLEARCFWNNIVYRLRINYEQYHVEFGEFRNDLGIKCNAKAGGWYFDFTPFPVDK